MNTDTDGDLQSDKVLILYIAIKYCSLCVSLFQFDFVWNLPENTRPVVV